MVDVVLQMDMDVERQPVSVNGLRSGKPLSYNISDGKLTIQLPELKLFEAIKIDFT
jgi:hypothetical protein